jgi:hypothetical protein
MPIPVPDLLLEYNFNQSILLVMPNRLLILKQMSTRLPDRDLSELLRFSCV